MGRRPVGRRGQPLVPPRLHARSEPRRPVRHERLRSLDVRALVLAAGHAAARPDRQPVLRHGPERRPPSRRCQACNLDDPSTWQYQVDPFCEPAQIPGTPNICVGMEQFNDTPIVNGTAYPTTTLEPKSYRFRILNAANDRFWNLSVVRRRRHGPDRRRHEVALKAAEVAAAQTDLEHRPDARHDQEPGRSRLDPDRLRGRLPAGPDRRPGQQPTTWITDPTRFDVGNVDKHSLLLAPAERADVIVDFSQVRGQDADPVQRRTRRLPGPGPVLRLLHRRPGHGRRRACPATARTPGPSCRSRSLATRRPRRST